MIAELERSLDGLWGAAVSPYLAQDLWRDFAAYDTGQYLLVPVQAAFNLGRADWQTEFAAHYERYLESSPAEMPAFFTARAHYYSVAAEYMLRADDADPVALGLYERLSADVLNEWLHAAITSFSGYAFEGREAAILFSLDADLRGNGTPYVHDADFYLFALAAQLRQFAITEGIAYDPELDRIAALAERVVTELGQYEDDGGWLFDPGRLTGHYEFRYAGRPDLDADLAVARVAEVEWDSSHAFRWPIWLTALRDGAIAAGSDGALFQDALDGLAQRFADHVLVAPGEAGDSWLLTNYMDGSNGHYRVGYAGYPALDGFGPYELTGQFLLGTWSLLDDPAVAAAYRAYAETEAFGPDDLRYLIDTRRTADRAASAFDWHLLLETGALELQMRLATGDAEIIDADLGRAWTVVLDSVLLAPGAMFDIGAALAADTDLGGVVSYQFYDLYGDATGMLLLDGAALPAGTIIQVDAADLPGLHFQASDPTGDLVLLRAFDGISWSNWSVWEARRQNSTPTATVDSIRAAAGTEVDPWALIAAADAEGDAIVAYELWHGTTPNGTGALLRAGTVQARDEGLPLWADDRGDYVFMVGDGPTADQLWVRVTDGAAWSAWQPFTIGRANAAPAVLLPDIHMAAGDVLDLAAWLSLTDADGDAIRTVRLWDAAGGSMLRIDDTAIAERTNVDVTLADLTRVDLLGGGGYATSLIYLQASDGDRFGDWITVRVTTFTGAISGGTGADLLVAPDHNSQLFGGDGDDTIVGGIGSDTLIGGAGNDTAVFAGPRAAYAISAIPGGVRVVHDAGAADDLFGIETLRFADGDEEAMTTYSWSTLTNGQVIAWNVGADILEFDGSPVFFSAQELAVTDTGSSLLLAYGGRTVELTGMRLTDVTTTNFVFLDGSRLMVGDNSTGSVADESANTLTGGSGEDVIRGLGGADVLYGGSGGDMLYGGDGNDTLYGSSGGVTYRDDVLEGGAGDDLLVEGDGVDTLRGGAGADMLRITSTDWQGTFTGTDGLAGEAATMDRLHFVNAGIYSFNSPVVSYIDRIDVSGATAAMADAHGNTQITLISADIATSDFNGDGVLGDIGVVGYDFYDNGAFTARLTVDGAALGSSQSLIVNGDTDTVDRGSGLFGGLQGNDSLSGGSGADTLRGGLGNDTLTGNGGADLLEGGDGADRLYGGTGDDTMDGGAGADSLVGSLGNDSIVGGAGDDTLQGDGGNDTLVGGDGNDIAWYTGNSSAYTITEISGGVRVSHATDGVDDLFGIETIRFSNTTAPGNRMLSLPAFISGTAEGPAGNSDSGGRLVFTVTLSTPSSGTVTVDYATSNGTALAGIDYVARSGTLTFAPGETSKTVTVWTIEDSVIEPGETVTLTLSNPSGAELGNASVSGTISNDDSNSAPVATATNAVMVVGVDKEISAGSMFSWTDANGDAAVTYRFLTPAAVNGTFYVDGVAQAASTYFNVAAADLADTVFVTGQANSNGYIQVLVYDGVAWSNSPQWLVQVRNKAAVTTAPDVILHTGTTHAASTLFGVTDADGDTITQYRFWDGTSGGARILVDSVEQAVGQNITVNAADLADVDIQAASGFVNDRMWVQVFDGTAWSAWDEFIVQSRPNTTPVVTPVAGMQYAGWGKAIAASTLFSVSDAQGDAITQYEFWDGAAAAHSGAFYIDGVRQTANVAILVAAADLADVEFRTATQQVSETLWVRAHDGTAWGAWASWTEAQINTAPVAAAPDAVLGFGREVAISTFFGTSDANGDAITQYRFWDGTSAAGSARIFVDGVAQSAGVNITVDAADLHLVTIRAANGVINDMMSVQVFDGYAWGAWDGFLLQSRNTAPVVTPTAATQYAGLGASIDAATLFGFSDADGHAAVAYEFWDGSAAGQSGSFYVDGVQQAANVAIAVAAADLADVEFRTSANGFTETLWVRASDGYAWSGWASWSQVQANTAPVITPTATMVYMVEGAEVAASYLFTWLDADGDAATTYRFWEDWNLVTTARFFVNGTGIASDVNVEIAAADLGTVVLRSGSYDGISSPVEQNDTFSIGVHDGRDWSNWATFTGRTVLSDYNLVGTSSGEMLIGNDNANFLSGGGGDDALVGGGDSDWFAVGVGNDTIMDFTSGDVVDLSAVAGLDTFAELLAMGLQSGAHTVFDFGGGNSLTLRNVDMGDLLEADFVL